MNSLARRFERLSEIPHLPLVQPTPVAHLVGASAETGAGIWVKRDDLSHELYGGNKVRKLEYLLADARAQGADTLVTAGATGSHHVLATSLFGTRAGFDVSAVMVRQPVTPHVVENLRCDLGAGASLHPVPTWAAVPPTMAALSASLRFDGKRPYMVAYGGSSAVGTLGYVAAGLELADQIAAGEVPEPDAIYVALGSGGTCSGLAIGLRAAGLTTPIVAVRVTPMLVCNRATLAALVTGVMRKLRRLDPAFPHVGRQALAQIEIDTSEYGRGYGTASARLRGAQTVAARDGLVLDTTYTARTFAAMLRSAQRDRTSQRLLYWHTLNSADLTPLVQEAPAMPAWALEGV